MLKTLRNRGRCGFLQYHDELPVEAPNEVPWDRAKVIYLPSKVLAEICNEQNHNPTFDISLILWVRRLC